MSFLDTSNPDFHAIAWNEDVSPAVAVIVGGIGSILYSTGREYVDGFRVYTLEQATVSTFNVIYDIDHGNGIFLGVCGGGVVVTSEDGAGWDVRSAGPGSDLRGVGHVSGNAWLAVGSNQTVIRSNNNGVNWNEITNPSNGNLHAVAAHGGIAIAVGDGGEWIRSLDDGLTWELVDSGLGGSVIFRDVIYGLDAFYMVGTDATIIKTVNGLDFEIISSPLDADFHGVAFSGGLYVVVGADSATITSTNGEVWDTQKAGVENATFNGVGFGDNRFVAVGDDTLVAYSATGTARPAFDQFRPISDVYRAQCFTQFGAYMIYGGIKAFEEGQWNYYPRRILNPSPGSVDDFESQGWFFVDLPGSGYLLDMVSIRGGIVLAESNQLSLLTDAGSLTAPWMYHQNYGEGLKPISNLTSFNGVGYVIADDGLIYTATNTGVGRLPGFFDLTQFEDWEPGTEAVWLGFDPIYQTLFVFRQRSPWTIWLVNDDTGGVSEMAIPELVIDGVPYEPRSAFIVNGLRDGIHVGYAATEGGMETLITARLDLDGAITGIDEPTAGILSRHRGDIQTGAFRMTALGMRGDINEVLVRTWADPEATVRPDIAVLVREECGEPWQTDDQPTGRIWVFDDVVYGDDTAWSRYIVKAPTERNIDTNLPGIEFSPIDVRVAHNAPIEVSVPSIVFSPIDVFVQTGQGAIQVNLPSVIFTPIDCQVTYGQAVHVTVPSIEFSAIDCIVDRGGFYELPWLVDQCDIFREDINGNRTQASYTKTGTRSILLDTPLGFFESLYVNPGPSRPFVNGRVGDYIFTKYGAHRVINVPTASKVELDWYPPVLVEGTYVPAHEIPEGGCGGDGKLIFGLGRGFDRLMIQVLIIPHGAVDATGAKITGLELGYHPTGPEMKTDAGGE